MKKILTLILFFFISCADQYDYNQHTLESNNNKRLLGSYCAEGCIWSSWAVSTGAQELTHYCDGEGCHCVIEGDIYSSCNNSNEQEEYHIQEYNSYKGNLIADEAFYEASSRGTYGWCYNAVADAVERITGPFLWGEHAYQAADQLSSSIDFYEVYDYTLTSLPSGAIVVWGKGSSRSGHISVSLGDGREASDHIAYQMTYHYGGARERVFYPK